MGIIFNETLMDAPVSVETSMVLGGVSSGLPWNSRERAFFRGKFHKSSMAIPWKQFLPWELPWRFCGTSVGKIRMGLLRNFRGAFGRLRDSMFLSMVLPHYRIHEVSMVILRASIGLPWCFRDASPPWFLHATPTEEAFCFHAGFHGASMAVP